MHPSFRYEILFVLLLDLFRWLVVWLLIALHLTLQFFPVFPA